MAINTGLIAYYRCANGNDEKSTYNATLSGVTVTSSGKYGDGWDFTNSVNDVATTSNISVDTSTGAYTASCWIYNINNGAANAGQATSFLTDTTTNASYMPFYLGYNFSGAKKVFAHVESGGSGYYEPVNLIGTSTQLIIDGSASPYVNAWMHLAIVASGTTITYYINGVATANVTLASLSGSFNFTRIGNLTSSWFGKHTIGDTLDEVAIWSRALSASEITSIYNSEINSLISGGGSVEQLNNILFYDKTNAKYQLPDTSDTFRLDMDTTIGGNLTVTGTTTTVHSETVLIKDNFLDLNSGNTTATATQGGLTINYLPTATKKTSVDFTAGVASTSAPTITFANGTDAGAFAADDVIQISDASEVGNDGLYIVKSVSGSDVLLYGVGGTAVPAAHTWAKNQLVTDTDATDVTKVAISIIKVDSSGDWQVGKGSNIASISYEAIQTGTDAATSLQDAYDEGATIATDATSGALTFSGNQLVDVTSSGGLRVTNGPLDINSTADFDVTSFDVLVSGAGFSIDGAGASNVSTSSGAMTLSGAGGLSLQDGTATLALAAAALTTTALASASFTPSGAFDVTAGAASTWSTTSGALTIDSAGVLTMDTDGTDAINLGTESAAKTITIGADASTQVDINALDIQLDAGSGGYDIDGAGNSTITTSGTGTLTIDSAGALVIDTDGTDSISIGTEAAAKTITVGNDASTKVDLNALAIELDSAGTIVANSAGAMTLDAAAASNFTVAGANLDLKTTTSGDVNVSAAGNLDLDGATVDIDSAAGLSLDAGAASNFTTSAGALTLNGAGGLSLQDGTATLSLASAALTSSSLASAALAPSGAFDVDAGAAMTLDAASFTVGGDGDTGAIAMTATSAAMTLTAAGINLAGGSSEIDITTTGALDANVGSVDIDSSAGVAIDGTTMSLDATDDSNFTVTGSGKDLVLAAAGGGAQKLQLDSAGTGSDAIDISATAGGIDVDAAGALDLASVGNASLTSSGGTVSINDAAGSIEMASGAVSTTGVASFDLQPSGAFDVAAGAESTLSVGSADLNLKTTTSGNIELEAAGYVYNKSFIAMNGNNPVTDSGAGIGVRMQAGEAISSGEVVFLGEDGVDNARWFKADADVAGKGFAVGVAFEAMSTGASYYNATTVCGSLVKPVFDSSPNQSDLGSRVYLSTTPGTVTLTPPSSGGDIQFQVGHLAYRDGSTSGNLIVWAPQYLASIPS